MSSILTAIIWSGECLFSRTLLSSYRRDKINVESLAKLVYTHFILDVFFSLYSFFFIRRDHLNGCIFVVFVFYLLFLFRKKNQKKVVFSLYKYISSVIRLAFFFRDQYVQLGHRLVTEYKSSSFLKICQYVPVQKIFGHLGLSSLPKLSFRISSLGILKYYVDRDKVLEESLKESLKFDGHPVLFRVCC